MSQRVKALMNKSDKRWLLRWQDDGSDLLQARLFKMSRMKRDRASEWEREKRKGNKRETNVRLLILNVLPPVQ